MRVVKFNLFVILMIMGLVGCDLLDTSVEEVSYVDSLEELNKDYSANLKISTLYSSESYVLCADGEVIGVVPEAREVSVKIDVTEDSLVNLWLIPVEDVESEDDLVIDNCKYTWIAKIYINSEVREWTPQDSSSDNSSTVTFYPSQMGSQEWDYAIGYLEGDTTYTPIAVITPYDDYGVSTEMDYGILSVNWSFYNHSPNSADDSTLIYTSTQDFVLTSDDYNKSVELPMVNIVSDSTIDIEFTNYESYIIKVTLNGSLIEESLTDTVIGSSYIEGNSIREYSELQIEDNNILIIYGDGGELGRIEFTADDNDQFLIEYSEMRGFYLYEIGSGPTFSSAIF